jgi:hypothetical protein
MRPSAKFQPSILVSLIFILVLCIGLFVAAGLTVVRAESSSAGWISFGGDGVKTAPEVNLLRVDEYAITLQATAPGVEVDQVTIAGQTYLSLGGEGYVQGGGFGAPALPVVFAEVEVPAGAKVSLEILGLTSQSTSLQAQGLSGLIAPRQHSQPKCGPAITEIKPNNQIYAQTSPYPAEIVHIVDEYTVRGHRILQLEFWPMRYTPATGELEMISEITFRLNLTGGDRTAAREEMDRLNSYGFNAIYANRVLNYNLSQPLAQPKTSENYLIITADAYASGLTDYVSLKQAQGYDVSVATISQVGGNTTTAIKNFIKAQYLGANPPEFVLLVGDYNNGADSITNYQFRTGSSSRTDLYFFTMDNEVEFVPDIFYGRFPVRNTTQLTNIINKLQAYEAYSGAEPWVKKAAFIATADEIYFPVAEGTHNYVINTYTAIRGYTGIFPTNPTLGGDKLYAITYDATGTNVVNSINDDRIMVIYSGHGSQYGWAGPAVSQSDVRNLTGVAVPYVASHACVTGDFTVNESFADTWIIEPVNGALSIAAASNNSYWDEDDILERVIFDTLYGDPVGIEVPTVSQMKHAGLVAVDASNTSMDQYYWEEYHIFGDPTIKVVLGPRTPDFTLAFNTTALDICSTDSKSVEVNIGSLNQYDEPVSLETSQLSGYTLAFEPVGPYTPPTGAALTLTGNGSADFGSSTLTLTGTSGSLTHTADLQVNTYTVLTAGPDLLLPEDGASDVPPNVAFSWRALSGAMSYRLQVATDLAFSNIILDQTGLTATSFSPASALQTDTRYYWRVVAENVCNTTSENAVFTFRTQPGPGDCPVGTTPRIIYLTDFEQGTEGWQDTSSGLYHWSMSTVRSHSPQTAWLSSVPAAISDQKLASPVFSLPTAEEPLSLSFWHRWTFDSTSICNDGGVLEISTNNGVTWSAIPANILLTSPYTGVIRSGVFNPLASRQAWCGVTDWSWTVVDLAAYAGQNVTFRFRMGSGNAGGAEGWYVDDVRVQSCIQPAPQQLFLPLLMK